MAERKRKREFTKQEVLRLARAAYSQNPIFAIDSEKTALLVIDMQDEFVKPHWTPFWVPQATQIVKRVRRLIDVCRSRKVPIVFTAYARTHAHLDRPKSGAFMPNRYTGKIQDDPAYFRDGKIWHELHLREDDILIQKPSYGAFFDTPLESILKNLERDTVIICGTLTNFCCGTTARQAYERGFKVVVGSDVTATDDAELHKAELKTLRKGFAMVLTSDQIIDRLVEK
ncbi:MAG TPA: isochorismatase family cysteine hydrolase [Candidatus Dormibacteraeota bacterium]|nr:isochorismatase family cysteine hydrolase [Candidatus Dormibacteraeota bacterium]